MKKQKLLLIGAVHTGSKPRGGEEYKNQLLVEFLRSRYTLQVIDTIHWKKRPKVLVRLVLHLLFRSYNRIIISASSASAYRLIQFLNIFPQLIRKTIYLVIGGYYPGAVLRGVYKASYYQRLYKIVVQGHYLKQILHETDLKNNVSVMPNFKPTKGIVYKKRGAIEPPIRFVFISRITEPKGVLTIFEALEKLKVNQQSQSFTVDFYGPIESSFQDIFNRRLSEFASFCTYKGYLDIMGDPNSAYKTLSSYDCMLFPTFWQGEGFPGVIIDAYLCGLPVIASNWNMNREVIEDGVTGFIIPTQDSEALMQAIIRVIQHPEILCQMREQCFNRAFEYGYDEVLSRDLQPLLDTESAT